MSTFELSAQHDANRAAERRRRRSRTTLAAGLLASVALPSFAFAADAADAANESASIEELVVTAEKRSASVTNTPVAIQVLTAAKLEDAAVSSFYDIQNVTPGLRMDLLGTNLQPTIRGVTSNTSGTGNNPNVAIYIDNYYMPSNLSNNLELADVQQIEVVKGPQGTLFGRNATGGAILVTTEAPSFNFKGKVEAGYGSDNDVRATGYITGPITDALAASLSVVYRDYEGFTQNILTGNKDGRYDTIGWRLKALYRPTDSLSITGFLHYANSHDGQGRVYRVLLPEGAATTGFSIPGTVVATERYTNSQDLQPMSTTRVLDGGVTTALDLNFATLTSYTGFQTEKTQQQTDLDGTSTKLTNISSRTDTSLYSQEFVLNSKGDGPLTWVVGANLFYNVDRAPDYRLATNANPNPSIARGGKIVTKAYAAFADSTWEFTPSWFLTGGLRYSVEMKDFKYVNAAGVRLTDVSESWDSLTPRLVLRHQFDPRSSVYASFSKGFKAGTFNASSSSNVPVNPEKITAYEIGYKVARPWFTWNSSAYHYTYTDMQVSSYDFTVAVPVTKLQNVGKATIYGVDTDFTWLINDNWQLVFNGAWTHARYDEFPGAIQYYPNASGIGYGTRAVDVSGHQMTRSPDYTASLTLNYTRPTEIGTFKFSAHPYYTSSHYTELAGSYEIEARTLLDLTASWTSLDDKWRFMVAAKNVFDTYYISYWDPVGTALMVNDGPPRQVRASLSYAF